MTTLINRVVQFVVVVLCLFGCGYLGLAAWNNWQTIQECRSRVVEVVNSELVDLELRPVSGVDFIESSVVFGVPPKLTFEKHLPRKDDEAGSRYIGNVRGTFDRLSGAVDFAVRLQNGDEHVFHRDLLPDDAP